MSATYEPGTKLRTANSSVVVTKKQQLYEIRRNGETEFPQHAMWDTVDLWLAEVKATEDDVTVEEKSKKPSIPRGKMAKWTYDQQLCGKHIINTPPTLMRNAYITRQYLTSQINYIKTSKWMTSYMSDQLKELEARLTKLNELLEKFPELKEYTLQVRRKTRNPMLQTSDGKMYPIYFHPDTGLIATGNSKDLKIGRSFIEIGILSPQTLWVYTDNTFSELKPISYSP